MAISFYSLSCETYSGTRLTFRKGASVGVSIRCRERRTAELQAGMVKDSSGNCVVSIRCRARRTAELVRARIPSRGGITTPSEFLFAVVRDVQRNRHIPGAWWCLAKFLFAVVRDVQRNWSRRQHFAGVDPRRVSIRCRARRTAEQ